MISRNFAGFHGNCWFFAHNFRKWRGRGGGCKVRLAADEKNGGFIMRFAMSFMKNATPIAAAVLVLALMTLGAGAVLIAAGVVAFAGLTLVLNPFGLLDGMISDKSRWCWAVGILCVYCACVLPLSPLVRFALILFAFLLFFIGWKQNGNFLERQGRPVSLHYSPSVSRALTAFRAGEENLGEERKKWRNGGIQAVQTALMMRGIPFDNKALAEMETAFVLGATSTKKDNAKKDALRDEIKKLEAENARICVMLERARSDRNAEAQEAYDDYRKAEESRERWQERALVAEEQALRYAGEISRGGGFTDEKIWEMLDGGMTGKEVAEQTGLSTATVSRIKNRRG